jgi:hypothetical protein
MKNYTITVLTSSTTRTSVHSDNLKEVKRAAKRATFFQVLSCRVYDNSGDREDPLMFESKNGVVIIPFKD